MAKPAQLIRRALEHRRFPLCLALGAVILMLPALWAGLFADDLIQRLTQFKPEELPKHAIDTGLVSSDSGKLRTVVSDLFGFLRREDTASRAREYGIVPWWGRDDWRAALWRPLTAFTHWLDYRLFPNTPALMHAHSILWYAAAVFLAATAYRKIAASAGLRPDSMQTVPPGRSSVGWLSAGLAGFLFLLDKNTYGPVMYVANRGFFISLVFGLLCLLAHHRWRTTQSRAAMWLSALCLLLALLANEGGASTLAFLLAYTLVLETSASKTRLLSLLPAAAVLLGWRTVYVSSGFGVKNFQGYIDPGYSPLLFLKNIFPRTIALLGGQLTGLPPEVSFGLSAEWKTILTLFFAGFSLLAAFVLFPVVRRDRAARFWFVVMLLALVPAATVAPLSKNLGFVAVGAFGVIASFFVGFAAPQTRATLPSLARTVSWCMAIWLLFAHVPAAIAARIGMAYVSPTIPAAWQYWCSLDGPSEIGDRDLIMVNDPTMLPIVIPFDRAYRRQPLPRSARMLAPGLTALEVTRPDAFTLIITAKESDMFECPALGPLHVAYGCKGMNDFLFAGRTWKAGERLTRKGFVAEIREVSAAGLPRSVIFRFDRPLESDDMVWLFFDWRRLAHVPFTLPKVGQTIEIAGPAHRG